MDDTLNISVELNGKRFNLKIPNNERVETIYRQAANLYNEAILNYKSKQYNGIDEKDILSMVAFNFAVKYLNAIETDKDNRNEILLSLQDINQTLDAYLE